MKIQLQGFKTLVEKEVYAKNIRKEISYGKSKVKQKLTSLVLPAWYKEPSKAYIASHLHETSKFLSKDKDKISPLENRIIRMKPELQEALIKADENVIKNIKYFGMGGIIGPEKVSKEFVTLIYGYIPEKLMKIQEEENGKLDTKWFVEMLYDDELQFKGSGGLIEFDIPFDFKGLPEKHMIYENLKNIHKDYKKEIKEVFNALSESLNSTWIIKKLPDVTRYVLEEYAIQTTLILEKMPLEQVFEDPQKFSEDFHREFFEYAQSRPHTLRNMH